MQRGKCCAHCPGNWGSNAGEARENHSCCLPAYVRGNLKVSGLRETSRPEDAERSERLRGKVCPRKCDDERPSSCYDRFAIARKFHAENLQHQPLPDRVDDSIFKNVRTRMTHLENSGGDVEQRPPPGLGANGGGPRGSKYLKKIRAGLQCGATLGCKTPTTNMDLAICWEAPLDPTYEPSRAVRIDGTDGGPAPAIFTLVEREVARREGHQNDGECSKNPLDIYEAKFSNLRNRCRCNFARVREASEPNGTPNRGLTLGEKIEADEGSPGASDKRLCDDLRSLSISDDHRDRALRGDPKRDKIQPLHLRNCSPCECRGDRAARKPRQRLTQSANVASRNVRRNGLPGKLNVPRPRTPYAKRSFCIDTLAPPFSIVHGCRDSDYPEHWRLTSVYQQSYRNPVKQRGTILNWD